MTEQFMENISNEEHERLLLLCGHGIGPSLSPAALAVMTAGTMGNPNVINDPVYQQCIAAALRAAVHWLAYENQLDDPTHVVNADDLDRIAAELEDASD